MHIFKLMSSKSWKKFEILKNSHVVSKLCLLQCLLQCPFPVCGCGGPVISGFLLGSTQTDELGLVFLRNLDVQKEPGYSGNPDVGPTTSFKFFFALYLEGTWMYKRPGCIKVTWMYTCHLDVFKSPGNQITSGLPQSNPDLSLLLYKNNTVFRSTLKNSEK